MRRIGRSTRLTQELNDQHELTASRVTAILAEIRGTEPDLFPLPEKRRGHSSDLGLAIQAKAEGLAPSVLETFQALPPDCPPEEVIAALRNALGIGRSEYVLKLVSRADRYSAPARRRAAA
jgi:hypothetical protein